MACSSSSMDLTANKEMQTSFRVLQDGLSVKFPQWAPWSHLGLRGGDKRPSTRTPNPNWGSMYLRITFQKSLGTLNMELSEQNSDREAAQVL